MPRALGPAPQPQTPQRIGCVSYNISLIRRRDTVQETTSEVKVGTSRPVVTCTVRLECTLL